MAGWAQWSGSVGLAVAGVVAWCSTPTAPQEAPPPEVVTASEVVVVIDAAGDQPAHTAQVLRLLAHVPPAVPVTLLAGRRDPWVVAHRVPANEITADTIEVIVPMGPRAPAETASLLRAQRAADAVYVVTDDLGWRQLGPHLPASALRWRPQPGAQP